MPRQNWWSALISLVMSTNTDLIKWHWWSSKESFLMVHTKTKREIQSPLRNTSRGERPLTQMHLNGRKWIQLISSQPLVMVPSLQLTVTHYLIQEERLSFVMSMVMAPILLSTPFWHKPLLIMAMSFVELTREVSEIQREHPEESSQFQIFWTMFTHSMFNTKINSQKECLFFWWVNLSEDQSHQFSQQTIMNFTKERC